MDWSTPSDGGLIRQLMTDRDCNAFQIPPAASARGHRAEDWRGGQIWKGKVRVMEIGNGKCSIQLVNDDATKSPFAECPVEGVEYTRQVSRCYDSTRFFALQVVNPQTKQKANLGIGFTDRNDAFDLVTTLDDFANQLK